MKESFVALSLVVGLPFCFGRGCLKRYEESSVSFLAVEAEVAAVVFADVDSVYHFHVRAVHFSVSEAERGVGAEDAEGEFVDNRRDDPVEGGEGQCVHIPDFDGRGRAGLSDV